MTANRLLTGEIEYGGAALPEVHAVFGCGILRKVNDVFAGIDSGYLDIDAGLWIFVQQRQVAGMCSLPLQGAGLADRNCSIAGCRRVVIIVPRRDSRVGICIVG